MINISTKISKLCTSPVLPSFGGACWLRDTANSSTCFCLEFKDIGDDSPVSLYAFPTQKSTAYLLSYQGPERLFSAASP